MIYFTLSFLYLSCVCCKSKLHSLRKFTALRRQNHKLPAYLYMYHSALDLEIKQDVRSIRDVDLSGIHVIGLWRGCKGKSIEKQGKKSLLIDSDIKGINK